MNFLLERSFADVDDLTEQAKQWDLDFRQLERGKFSGHLLQFGVQGVQIAEARFKRTLHQRGAPPRDMRTIAIPARADLQLEWRGKAIDGSSLMVFPGGGELSSVSDGNFHVFTCTFSETLLARAADALQLGHVSRLLDKEAIRVNPDAAKALRGFLSQTCRSIQQSPQSMSTAPVVEGLTRELPARILSTIDQACSPCQSISSRNRLAAVTNAISFMDKHVGESLTVSDICRAAGVSERTLRYAFLERFGIGPKEYLKAQRLLVVRRGLRAANASKTRVADVANAAGFWHMGQFAADYRKRFDELPSCTLQNDGGPRDPMLPGKQP